MNLSVLTASVNSPEYLCYFHRLKMFPEIFSGLKPISNWTLILGSFTKQTVHKVIHNKLNAVFCYCTFHALSVLKDQ